MHINNPNSSCFSEKGSDNSSQKSCCQAVKSLLKEAKKLHRAAVSRSNAQALPVLRRLISSGSIRDMSLLELRRQKGIIQRKHLLHMLAIESGYNNWTAFRRAIEALPLEEASHYSLALSGAGYPNLWFSSLIDAKKYTDSFGGNPVSVGGQAVVIPVNR